MRVGRPPLATVKLAAGAVAIIVYAALSSWLMATQPRSALAMVFVLGPMTIGIVGALWRGVSPGLAIAAAIAAIAVFVLLLNDDGWSPKPLYVAQEAGIHAALALVFAVTLRRGSTPLVTRMAARLQTPTPAMLRYTRHSTIAWVVYFVAMTLVSIAIYAWAPFGAWIACATFGTPTGLVLMFVVEHRIRYLLHPEFPRLSIASAWHAWKAERADPPIDRSGAPS